MDPHSFFANPDPAVFLDADLDPALKKKNLVQNSLLKSFLKLKKLKRLRLSKKQTFCATSGG